MKWNTDFSNLKTLENVLLLCKWDGPRPRPFILIGKKVLGISDWRNGVVVDGFYEDANCDCADELVLIESNVLAWQPLPSKEIEE